VVLAVRAVMYQSYSGQWLAPLSSCQWHSRTVALARPTLFLVLIMLLLYQLLAGLAAGHTQLRSCLAPTAATCQLHSVLLSTHKVGDMAAACSSSTTAARCGDCSCAACALQTVLLFKLLPYLDCRHIAAHTSPWE
jgi:hypothetical protein